MEGHLKLLLFVAVVMILGVPPVAFGHLQPTAGRFLARDPIAYTDGSNTYSYCAASPISRLDPAGLCTCILPTIVEPAHQCRPDMVIPYWITVGPQDGTCQSTAEGRCSGKCRAARLWECRLHQGPFDPAPRWAWMPAGNDIYSGCMEYSDRIAATRPPNNAPF
jgi:hypothetical protein